MSCPLGWNITETAKDGPPEPDYIEEYCPCCGSPMRWYDEDQSWWCWICRKEYSEDLIGIERGDE